MKITKSDIKGVAKVFLIIVLVGATIAGTCYLFFRYLNRSQSSYAEVGEYVYSVEREEFVSDLNSVNSNAFNVQLTNQISSIEQATSVTKVLLPYLNSDEIENSEIMNNLLSLIEIEEVCKTSVDDYLNRLADITFDRTNVSIITRNLSNYLTSYAQMLLTINTEIETNLKYQQTDVKFSVIDAYARALTNCYGDLTESGGTKANNVASLNKFSDVLNFSNSNIVLSTDNYLIINDFISNYNNCDKFAFATALYDISSITRVQEGDSLNNALYYFKQIFGLS